MLKTKKTNQLSFIVHTKNEAENIAECIDSVKEIVDEILVIDMQSTDKTVEIAKKKGAKIFKVKDMGSADPARNFGISKASFPWIFYLDADERIPSTLKSTITQIIKEDQFDLVKFPEKNIIFNKWIKSGMWWPDYHIRLFKKGSFNYPKTVHTQPNYHGKVLTLPPENKNAIIHHHRKTIKEFLDMVDHYSSLDIKFTDEVVKAKKLTPEEILKFINKEFSWRYFEHKGYQDGMHGFVINMFMNFYRFLEFAKYWEKTGFKEIVDNDQFYKLMNNYSYQSDELQRIKSSKFYNMWTLYTRSKDRLLRVTKRKS